MISDRRLVPLAEVHEEKTTWIWPGRVPAGAVTLLDGDPAQGKSTLACDLIARLTTGRPMPGCDEASCPAAGVVLLAAEDALGSTVRPRLQHAGADVRRIVVDDRKRSGGKPLVLPDDLAIIEAAAVESEAKLVVLDPFGAFVAGPVHADHGVRAVLGPLAALGERLGLAVMVLRHLRKGGGGNPLHRGLGSIGIVAAARSALLAANDPTSDDPFQHVLVTVKSNLSDAGSLTYRTVKRDGTLAVEWLGPSTCSARDLTSSTSTDSSQLADAGYVLFSLLMGGPLWSTEIYKQARDEAYRSRPWTGRRSSWVSSRGRWGAGVDRVGTGTHR